MTAVTEGRVSLDLSQTPKVPLTRLVRVELRKMADTRAGIWLLIAIAALVFVAAVDELHRRFVEIRGEDLGHGLTDDAEDRQGAGCVGALAVDDDEVDAVVYEARGARRDLGVEQSDGAARDDLTVGGDDREFARRRDDGELGAVFGFARCEHVVDAAGARRPPYVDRREDVAMCDEDLARRCAEHGPVRVLREDDREFASRPAARAERSLVSTTVTDWTLEGDRAAEMNCCGSCE